jgi:hypothetical protein
MNDNWGIVVFIVVLEKWMQKLLFGSLLLKL